MNRRAFISHLGALAGGSLSLPRTALGQRAERVRRVGVLVGFGESDAENLPRLNAFRQRLQELGWVDGRNVEIIYRWSAGDPERIRAYAAELVALAPDVIMAHSPPVVAALQRATRTIPVVFVQVTGAVESGFVSNVARPDGNITGFETFELEMTGKWLDLLKELRPDAARVAVLHDPDNPAARGRLRVIESLAPAAAVRVISAGVHSANDIERAIGELAREPHGGLLVLPDNVSVAHREQIVALANKHRLPAVYPFRYFAAAGGVMSYGTDLTELYRAVASYVGRILKGARPGDLPVQGSTRFELVINLKTAKALGLDVPPTLLARADEVIE
jgi:putative ABC transport system substrate-binding protein